MSFVHHLVVYKSPTDSKAKPGFKAYFELPRAVFHSNAIVFAWARTGQKAPLAFDFDPNSGVLVGPDSDAMEIYLNIHFEVPRAIASAPQGFPVSQ